MAKRFNASNALVLEAKRNKGGGFLKVKFQLTPKVTAALEWPEMPEGTAEWTPDVDTLAASIIELKPNNAEFASKAMTLDCTQIGDFQVQRKAVKEGKNAVKASKRITEVICTIKFSDPIGLAKLEQYPLVRSEMLVVYTPQPKQGDLPGTQVDMTVEPDLFQSPEAAAAVEEIPDGPTLGSAMQVVGGTHAKRGRARPRKDA